MTLTLEGALSLKGRAVLYTGQRLAARVTVLGADRRFGRVDLHVRDARGVEAWVDSASCEGERVEESEMTK